MVCARADMVEGTRIGRRAVFVPSSMVVFQWLVQKLNVHFYNFMLSTVTGGLRCALNCISDVVRSGVLVILYGVSLEEASCIWWVKACW